MVPRLHYIHIPSRQGRPKQIRISNVQMIKTGGNEPSALVTEQKFWSFGIVSSFGF
jgi:hypothetical protein